MNVQCCGSLAVQTATSVNYRGLVMQFETELFTLKFSSIHKSTYFDYSCQFYDKHVKCVVRNANMWKGTRKDEYNGIQINSRQENMSASPT